MKKSLAVLVLVFALLLCSCAPAISDGPTVEPATESATPSQTTAPSIQSTEPPTTELPTTEPSITEPSTQPTDPNDPATADFRLLINTYFSQRTDFLQGVTSDIPSAITAVVNDEKKHLDALTSHQVTLLSSSFTIHSITPWDKHTEISATETVLYQFGSTPVSYTISHKIDIDCTQSDNIIVSSDAYYDEAVDFYSCSYVRLPDNYPNLGN